MSANLITLLGVVAGFAMIGVAAFLAFRQSMTWQHVIVFCLGGVLTGISGVQFQSTDVSVTIGKLNDANTNNTLASTAQTEAMTTLSQQVAQLQDEVNVLTARASGSGTSGSTASAASSAQQSAKIATLLSQSRAYSGKSLAISRYLGAKVPALEGVTSPSGQ